MSEPKLVRNFYLLVNKLELINLRASFQKVLDLYKDKEILGVEVGVYEGINSRVMLASCANLKLCLVDDWSNMVIYTGGPIQEESFRNTVRQVAEMNLLEFGDRVFFTNKNSLEAVKDFTDESLDYVYIDGDHTTEAVKLDLSLWYPKVKKGGVLGGHDILMDEVSIAVEEFVKNNNITNWGRDEKNLQGRSDFWIFK